MSSSTQLILLMATTHNVMIIKLGRGVHCLIQTCLAAKFNTPCPEPQKRPSSPHYLHTPCVRCRSWNLSTWPVYGAHACANPPTVGWSACSLSDSKSQRRNSQDHFLFNIGANSKPVEFFLLTGSG